VPSLLFMLATAPHPTQRIYRHQRPARPRPKPAVAFFPFPSRPKGYKVASRPSSEGKTWDSERFKRFSMKFSFFLCDGDAFRYCTVTGTSEGRMVCPLLCQVAPPFLPCASSRGTPRLFEEYSMFSTPPKAFFPPSLVALLSVRCRKGTNVSRVAVSPGLRDFRPRHTAAD